MKIKCHNCNHECDEIDVFCSVCGAKLIKEINLDKSDKIEKETLNTIKSFDNQNANSQVSSFELSFSKNRNFFESPVFNFVLIMLIVSFLLCAILYLSIQRQTSHALNLQFKNLINNPSQIPQLTEPTSFESLAENLKATENFLALYLRYSKDSADKKERIFVSYLKEIEKMPHITTQNFSLANSDKCSNVDDYSSALVCAKKLNKIYEKIGIKAFPGYNATYIYPDYDFIFKKYSKYLSTEISQYLRLRAKYNSPVVLGLDMFIKPSVLADKIYSFEKFYNSNQNEYLKDIILKILYDDFRNFIFLPSIYATTTQEMKSEFKNAYKKFIKKNIKSQLTPVLISYLEKQREYSEENFENDYPYKKYQNNFEQNVQNSTLQDVFAQLRKTILSTKGQYSFTYVYNILNSNWRVFEKNIPLTQGEYAFSSQDENNNILIYNNTFSLLQELNIPKYSKLYLINGILCAFNSDKLTLSKVIFNGKKFFLQQMNSSDITSLFPGIDIIYIDSYQDYSILIEKMNKNAGYIILSGYSGGFDGYIATAQTGEITQQNLPNMFLVSSDNDVVVLYKNPSISSQETSETMPTFKITIHTKGSENQPQEIVNYDEKTAQEENTEQHKANIMPKIEQEENNEIEEVKEKLENDEEYIPQNAPMHKIEPPSDDVKE